MIGPEYRTEDIGAAGLHIMLNIDYSLVRVYPDYIDWKFHVLHPKCVLSFVVKHKQHGLVFIKSVFHRQSICPLFLGCCNVSYKYQPIQCDVDMLITVA